VAVFLDWLAQISLAVTILMFNGTIQLKRKKIVKITAPRGIAKLTSTFLLASTALCSISRAQVPVFEIAPVENTVKFDVKASVAIVGKFDKWGVELTFKSPELSTGVLDIKIQAATVDTGNGVKNGKLKGKDFFDVEKNPLITFHSTRLNRPAQIPLPSTATSQYAE
jgi:polyisoprenoid-binding protein YceI